MNIHIGFYNPTQEPDSDEPARRRRLTLREDDLIAHIHGLGATRSGKSKWIEGFCRELYKGGAGFTLIDPQGKLVEDLVNYFTVLMPFRPVYYFDPSRGDYLIPFNPFRPVPKDPADPNWGSRVNAQVSKQVESVLRAWGARGTDDTPRLGRWLYCVFFLFATGLVTMNEIYNVVSYKAKDAALDWITDRLSGFPVIQGEWMELNSTRNVTEFNQQVESIRNRLFRFVTSPQIIRLMSLEVGLSFQDVLDSDAVVLANLQGDSDILSSEDASVIGTLFINEIWKAARRRTSAPSQPYFLLIDEVERFLTPDLSDILDRGAGMGLRLGIFHQHLGQLEEKDPETYRSVMTNARLKLVFGGISKDDARTMVDEIFAGQIDYTEAKHIVEQTKFWPVYTRDIIIGDIVTEGHSEGAGAGFVSGQSVQTLPGSGELVQVMTSGSQSDIQTSGYSESYSRSVTNVPIFYPVPFVEETGRQLFSLEEQKNKLADALKTGLQMHYFFARPGAKTTAAVSPLIHEQRLPPDLSDQVILDEFIKPFGAVSVADIDRALKFRKDHLQKAMAKEKEKDEVPDMDYD